MYCIALRQLKIINKKLKYRQDRNSPASTLIDCTCQLLIFTQTVNVIIKLQLSMKMAGDIQTFVNLTDLMVFFMGQASLANQADAFHLQLIVASKLRQISG